MKARVKYHIIYRHRTEYSVAVMCKFFAVLASGENNHSGSIENNQFQSNKNNQSKIRKRSQPSLGM